jgi:hypothetical protein
MLYSNRGPRAWRCKWRTTAPHSVMQSRRCTSTTPGCRARLVLFTTHLRRSLLRKGKKIPASHYTRRGLFMSNGKKHPKFKKKWRLYPLLGAGFCPGKLTLGKILSRSLKMGVKILSTRGLGLHFLVDD